MIHSDNIIYNRDHRLKIRKLPHKILRNTASGLEIQIRFLLHTQPFVVKSLNLMWRDTGQLIPEAENQTVWPVVCSLFAEI